MTADADAEPVEATESGRTRRRVAIALIVIASVLAFFAIFALWANRQLLDTDNWAQTSSELLEREAIRTQIASFLVDELYANVDVQSELEQVFEEALTPQRAAVLAGPAAGGLRSLAEDAANRLLQPVLLPLRKTQNSTPPTRDRPQAATQPATAPATRGNSP